MKPAAPREIDVFEYEGAFKATLQSKVFCSPYWQDHTCREVDTPEGRKVRVDPGIYPPGGKGATAMRRCDTCGKWAPHAVADSVCTDCQVASDEEGFEGRLQLIERGSTKGLADTLRHLWWRRAFIPHRRRDEAAADEHEQAKQSKGNTASVDDEDAPPIMEITTFREEGTPGGRYWQAGLLEVPERPAPRLNSEILAALLRRHLEWVARDTPRRAVGCSVVLLPEDEAKLKQEIAYHEATGRIMPGAKRQNTVNPRIFYRKKPT
jgi:hypothetical protein